MTQLPTFTEVINTVRSCLADAVDKLHSDWSDRPANPEAASARRDALHHIVSAFDALDRAKAAHSEGRKES